MQFLKISSLLVLTVSLCSFAYYSNNELGREEVYKAFLSEFETVNLPTTIELKPTIVASDENADGTIDQKEVKVSSKILGMKYSHFIPSIDAGMMSRMGPSTYEAEVMLANNNKAYSTVIYSESRPFDISAKTYTLATFDQSGDPIASRFIGYGTLDEVLMLEVNENMEMTSKSIIKDEHDEPEIKNEKKIFITPKGEILVHGDSDLYEMPVRKSLQLKKSTPQKRVG